MNEQEIIPKKLNFEVIGEIINATFENFKKSALISGLSILILFIVGGILMSIIFKNVLQIDFSNPELLKSQLDPKFMSFQNQLQFFGVIIIINLLIAPFLAGILEQAKEASNNEEAQFSSFYKYINHPKFGFILLLNLIVSIIPMALSLLFGTIVNEFILQFISIFISVLIYFSLPLLIYSNLNPINAIVVSAKACLSNFWITVLVLILSIVLGIFGILAFCLGIFFTLPFLSIFKYELYKMVFQNEKNIS